jgi:hypothetical protein
MLVSAPCPRIALTALQATFSRDMLQKGYGLSDTSRVEPEDDRGEDEHGAVVDGALLVARCQSTPLLEAIEAPLEDVAPGISRLVEGERTTRSDRVTRPLIAPLRNGVRDLAPSEQLATAWVAIAFVGDEAI